MGWRGSHHKKRELGSSLAVQWLGLGAFTAGARVQSLVRELGSRKPRSMAKRKKKRERERKRTRSLVLT